MAIPILTSFDRALLLDLSSLGRPDYRKDIRAVSESTAYMVECGLLMRRRRGLPPVVTDAGRRASVEG